MKNKVFIIIIIVIFLLGVAGSAPIWLAPAKSHIRVVSGGKVIYSADLRTAEDTTFDVSYEGHVNTVEIRNHQIRVASADCPDQTCVRMGWLRGAGTPIVCLPHDLVIEYTDSTDDIDAVTR